MRTWFFVLLILTYSKLSISEANEAESVTRSLFARATDFVRPDLGFDQRLQDIGLSGKLWKIFNYGNTDCPTNSLSTIRRLEFHERNFDIRQAYVAYLPFFNERGATWNFHVTLIYKGLILDSEARQSDSHFSSGVIMPYSIQEYLKHGEEKFDPKRKIVLMPAERYKWEMRFNNGRPPKIMEELGSYYTTQKVPHGMHVLTAEELIEIVENSQLTRAPRICGYLF